MAQIFNLIKKADAEKLFTLYSRVKYEEAAERNWCPEREDAAVTAFGKFYKELGLNYCDAKQLCWYVWAVEGNNQELPNLIDMRIIKADYEHTHRQYST